MNITLKQLRVFCALYELRSFTAAARAAFVTQSAVSKLCAELEAEIGQPLFERSTRSVTPCEGAAQFYAYAQEILGTVRAAERSLQGMRSLEKGMIGIASSPMMMVGLLGKTMAGFHAEHPGVKFELHELSTDATIDYVRHGRVDFGIASLEGPLQPELAAERIFRDTMHVTCAAQHPLARSKSTRWSDLAHYDHIALHPVNSVRRSVDRIAADLKLQLHYAVEGGMLTTVFDLVRANLGITVIPGYATQFARKLGLKTIPIADLQERSHDLWLIQRTNTRESMAASVFLKHLKSHLSHLSHLAAVDTMPA